MWCVKLSDSQRDALRALLKEQPEKGQAEAASSQPLDGALQALDLARWDDLPEASLPWQHVSDLADRQGIGEADVVWDLTGRVAPAPARRSGRRAASRQQL